MRHLDLFSGIGGFSLAARWCGMETIGFCETDPWCRRVLAKNFPGVPHHDDIRTLTGDIIEQWGGCDLITGGFPCQPYSVAGKRRGAADDRHLWPEMLRVIADCRPRWVLGENTPGIISMALDAVLDDLEAEGYTCWAMAIPAIGVDAPHKRERVWIVAHRNAGQRQRPDEAVRAGWTSTDSGGTSGSMADAGQGDGGRWPNATGGDDRNGYDAGRQEAPGGIDERGEGMADANASRQPQPQRGVGQQWGWAGDSGGGLPLPHTTPRGIRRGRASGHHGQPAQPREGMADTTRQCGERSGQTRQRRAESPDSGEGVADCVGNGLEGVEQAGTATGAVERGRSREEAPWSMDIGPDGLPAGLVRRLAAGSAEPDLIRQAWADGSWERDLSRVTVDEPERRQKLQAAGNAIVPVSAYEIMRLMS